MEKTCNSQKQEHVKTLKKMLEKALEILKKVQRYAICMLYMLDVEDENFNNSNFSVNFELAMYLLLYLISDIYLLLIDLNTL